VISGYQYSFRTIIKLVTLPTFCMLSMFEKFVSEEKFGADVSAPGSMQL